MVVDAELGRETARFYYHALSLEKSRAEDFLAKPQPLAWALAALMRAETMSRAEHKLACLQRIATTPLDELHRFLLVNCVETYLQLEGRDAEELEALQARGNTEEVRVMRRMTWAEQLVEEGWEKGVEQGREQGREQGLEQGFRQALLRLLGARFGPLSDDVKRRVEAIRSIERLNQVAEQILVARSLEEMGLR
jgi:flagellar biosynthesis/type III secretory pathway protein FliH